jgi:predicted DNA-binding ribbon-helix-helix protein
MKSFVAKRSVVVEGHKTSVSLEEEFWVGLKEIILDRAISMSELIAQIDKVREHGNLSSALRLHVLEYYRLRSTGQAQSPDSGKLE